ncbi:MAG: M14 family zinc carboxypeptidase [Acidobacteriota bacterium]
MSSIRWSVLCVLPLLLAAKPAPRPVGPDGRAEYRIVQLLAVNDLQFARLAQLGFDLERDGDQTVVAYVTAEEMDKLQALGIGWLELPKPQPQAPSPDQTSYHDYTALTTQLQNVASAYPNITRLVSAGKSVQGRELWWLKITDNPDSHEDEPAFKYISTMHGDEPVGTEMLLRLIDLLTQGYGTDTRATRIVNEVELWVMPMMNPDGNTLSQRYNADGVDLNRDFPDQFQDPVDSPAGRAIETQRIMNWQYGHRTMLSANFHTGAVVVNYPYDGTASGASVYSSCPDDDIFRNISLDYSEDNSPMYNGAFPQGITNGADWYNVYGGMQDWNYLWHGDTEVTIELNNPKWPAASVLDQRWNENRESMLSYLERSLSGVRGRITDAVTGAPVSATLKVAGRNIAFYTDANVGDYHRVLPAGSFTINVQATGYNQASFPVTITNARATATRVDLQLQPLPVQLLAFSSRVVSDSGGNGFFDAGESGQLAVTLQNTGGMADNPHGRMLSLTKYASVGNEADWADIAAAGVGETLSPHFGINVASNAPAGHKLAFAVDWNTLDGRSGTTDAFFVPLSMAATAQRSSTDTPKPIPDPGQIQSLITVAGDDEIYDANVRVDIAHPYIGDLRVSLIGPDGTTVRLHDQQGGSSNDIHTVYDTQTAPIDSLAAFNGKSTQGTWKLKVEDLSSFSRGTLTSWVLELVTRPFEAKLPEVQLRTVTKSSGGRTRLEWWPVGSAQTYKLYRSNDPTSASSFVDVTGEDPTTTDLTFLDASGSTPGSLTFWIVSATGHNGEGDWGHYGR